jgi:ParB family transcriptional regulator, chromosome partitioning protein
VVEVELHQLTRRYEHIRKRQPQHERLLLSSLVENGQRLPAVVVAEAERFVLIDGYKRARALQRLGQDTIRVTLWQVEEADALLLERALRQGREDALDQAWLLAELQERFGWSLEQLAVGFGRSKSWVSRRLGLIKDLPQEVQNQVRQGALSAHVAMKYLLPLARANASTAQQLAQAIAPHNFTTRDVGELYQGLQKKPKKTQELILSSPHLYLQALAAKEPAPPSATERLLEDLGSLGGIARRALKTLKDGLLQQLLDSERQEIYAAFAATKADLQRLINRLELEDQA